MKAIKRIAKRNRRKSKKIEEKVISNESEISICNDILTKMNENRS